MKNTIIVCSLILVLSAIGGSAWGFYEGVDDTRYGYWAGSSSGGDTFIGVAAGMNITGWQNTFVGHNAGKFTTSGSYNTFIGGYAGQGSTAGYLNTGWWNTFVGASAGADNTSGSNNTFIGRAAGANNTIGKYNTFLGYDAGNSNVNGNRNTFLGFNAGFMNDKGNWNTFVGAHAGRKNKRYANTFLGESSGYLNRLGSNNVFLGFAAGHENETGSGNVFLGCKAGYNEKGSHRLYIDNSNTFTPLIYGEFDKHIVAINGKVGIGKKPSTHPLEIAGGAYTDGFKWYPASSGAYKDDIKFLSPQKAFATLAGLNPVKFVYKADRVKQHVGFIAEDVPELVSTKDRKGLSVMDIVAVLTKVVQEQEGVIREQRKMVEEQQRVIAAHAEKIAELEQMLKARGE